MFSGEFLENRSKFERELLSSQTTHQNELILYGKILSWRFQKVQNHFCGWPVSWAIRDWNRSILSRFLKSLFLIFLIFRANFRKNRSKFDRELLSSQTTHRNELVLYVKILSWGFQKVQNHFCGWPVSQTIGDLILRKKFYSP